MAIDRIERLMNENSYNRYNRIKASFFSRKFMIMRSSIAFEDFLCSSIAPQVMPPCLSNPCKIKTAVIIISLTITIVITSIYIYISLYRLCVGIIHRSPSRSYITISQDHRHHKACKILPRGGLPPSMQNNYDSFEYMCVVYNVIKLIPGLQVLAQRRGGMPSSMQPRFYQFWTFCSVLQVGVSLSVSAKCK